MPLYDYECEGGHRFEEFRSMDNRNNVVCPMCMKPVRIKISLASFRFAEPITFYQDLGGVGSRHKGYQEIGWKADGGISPKPGQPYKTSAEVVKEEHQGIKEV